MNIKGHSSRLEFVRYRMMQTPPQICRPFSPQKGQCDVITNDVPHSKRQWGWTWYQERISPTTRENTPFFLSSLVSDSVVGVNTRFSRGGSSCHGYRSLAAFVVISFYCSTLSSECYSSFTFRLVFVFGFFMQWPTNDQQSGRIRQSERRYKSYDDVSSRIWTS
jgi:hypothetical protein